MTRTTRTKISPAALLCSLLIAAVLAPLSSGQSKPGRKETPHAVIAGTVFRDPGFAQSGAAVTLSRKDDPKQKKQEAISDSRGEFAFHVPPVQATYVVHAALKGFKPAQEQVQIGGEEQVNATLVLVPESK